MTYEEIRATLCEVYGWDFATVDNLSFEQIGSACRKGVRSKGIPVASAADVENVMKNWRKYAGI